MNELDLILLTGSASMMLLVSSFPPWSPLFRIYLRIFGALLFLPLLVVVILQAFQR